jgi:hypothetical protein
VYLFFVHVAFKRFSPVEVRERLKQLIQQANRVEPNLAHKLSALVKWIKDKKDGLLASKPYVLDLLGEMILDTEIWLMLQSLSPEDKQQLDLSITEQYWLEVLFPKWINDRDPKFPSWKREVMDGQFKREDETILQELFREIKKRDGSYLWKYLLDLSMATDLLASGELEEPLCTQLTTLSEPYFTEKRQKWEETLTYWGIERGIIISYNPMEKNLVTQLVTVILQYSDRPLTSCYTIIKDLR